MFKLKMFNKNFLDFRYKGIKKLKLFTNNIEYIFLSNNKLKNIKFKTTLKFLEISYNRFIILKYSMIQNSNILYLIINSNKLKYKFKNNFQNYYIRLYISYYYNLIHLSKNQLIYF